MQSAQNRFGHNSMIDGNVVSASFDLLVAPWIGNARSQARMGSSLIVVHYPLFQDSSHMPLVQRDEEIKTFSSDRAYQPFTESIRLRCPKRSSQDRHAQRLEGRIKLTRVDAVPVVDDESVGLVPGDDLSKLLACPSCGGMIGHVEVSNPAGSYLHDHKDIENSKASRHDDEEIAGPHRLGVISYKCHPLLRRDVLARSNIERHVPSDGPRRHPNSQFEEQFSSDPLFSPRGILLRHLEDQFLESRGHTRPPARPRFPSPEQAKSFPMPTEEGPGLDVDQGSLPCKKPREQNQRQASSVPCPPRLDLAFEIKGELFP